MRVRQSSIYQEHSRYQECNVSLSIRPAPLMVPRNGELESKVIGIGRAVAMLLPNSSGCLLYTNARGSVGVNFTWCFPHIAKFHADEVENGIKWYEVGSWSVSRHIRLFLEYWQNRVRIQ